MEILSGTDLVFLGHHKVGDHVFARYSYEDSSGNKKSAINCSTSSIYLADVSHRKGFHELISELCEAYKTAIDRMAEASSTYFDGRFPDIVLTQMEVDEDLDQSLVVYAFITETEEEAEHRGNQREAQARAAKISELRGLRSSLLHLRSAKLAINLTDAERGTLLRISSDLGDLISKEEGRPYATFYSSTGE